MYEEAQSMMQNPWVKWGVTLSIIFLATFLGVKTLSIIKEYKFIGGGVPATNVVTVSGEGEIFAVPDTATFTFSVVEEAVTVEEAQSVATEKINKLVEYLKDEKIKEEDIKTLSYNVYPRYEFKREGSSSGVSPRNGTRELVGFEIRQGIQVKVGDTKKAGELLSGVGSFGASDISGLQFTIDDEDSLREEARKEAIQDAKKKARQLARDLDVHLVRVVSFNEYGAGPLYGIESFGAVSADSSLGRGGAVPEIPTGENRIISNVSITYEIR